MRLDEIFGFSFGKKKEPELKLSDITPEERKMIVRAFDGATNANLKMANGEYVLPQNVTLIYDRVRVNFYKDRDQLIASIGWYKSEGDPGDPKMSPITTTERKINSQEDLYKLKDLFDAGGDTNTVSADSLRYKEMKRDLSGKV